MSGDTVRRAIWVVENDHVLAGDERQLVLDLLSRQIRKPRHRPPSASVRRRNLDIVMFVLRDEQSHGKRDAAVQAAADHFGRSVSHVWRCIREWRETPLQTAVTTVAGITKWHVRSSDNEEWQEVDRDRASKLDLPGTLDP